MNNQSERNKKQREDFARALSQFSQIGFTIAACVLVGVFLGQFIDGLLDTAPTFLLLFSLFGAAASLKLLFDMAKKK